MPHMFSRASPVVVVDGGRRGPAVQSLGVVVPAVQVEVAEQQDRHPDDVLRPVVITSGAGAA